MRISDWRSDVVSSDLDRVGDQFAGVHDPLRLTAERGAGCHRLAQHLAGRELADAVGFLEPLRLGTLARSRRAQQNQVQPRLPRIFDFLISPSYWCARRCDWTWVTVSIVTVTTISRQIGRANV